MYKRQVSYGGGFVTTRAAIRHVPQASWARIVHTLSRGENIEESHYLERSWAALLTLPLTADLEGAMTCATRRANADTMSVSPYFSGKIQRCFCSEVAKCRNMSRAEEVKAWTSGASSYPYQHLVSH